MNSFRLPPETRVSRVRLRTANLARALDFYERVMGFHVIERDESQAALSATGGAPALLALAQDATAAARSHPTTGLYHLAVRYPTRRDLAHALRRLGADWPITGGSTHGFGQSIHVDDADGNGVELYFDLPRRAWPIRNGRIVLSGQQELVLGDLLALVEEEPVAARPPPATDIGHINLHVADLAEATGFFHDFLGFEVMGNIGPNARFLSAGGYHHHVAVNTWAGAARARPNAVGLMSYRLGVPSRETLTLLEERARQFGHEARFADEVLQIRDPNRNWLEVEFERAVGDAGIRQGVNR